MNLLDQHLLGAVRHVLAVAGEDLVNETGGIVRASVEIIDPISIDGEIDNDAKQYAELTLPAGDPALKTVIYGSVLRDNAAGRAYTVRKITPKEVSTVLRCSISS